MCVYIFKNNKYISDKSKGDFFIFFKHNFQQNRTKFGTKIDILHYLKLPIPKIN